MRKKFTLLLGTLFLVGSAIAKEGPTFQNDVLSVLTKHGCNTGDCHGAASGKDGFMLSLFGYDVPGDYYRLIEEIPGRRIDLAEPAESLLLQKPPARSHTPAVNYSSQIIRTIRSC